MPTTRRPDRRSGVATSAAASSGRPSSSASSCSSPRSSRRRTRCASTTARVVWHLGMGKYSPVIATDQPLLLHAERDPRRLPRPLQPARSSGEKVTRRRVALPPGGRPPQSARSPPCHAATRAAYDVRLRSAGSDRCGRRQLVAELARAGRRRPSSNAATSAGPISLRQSRRPARRRPREALLVRLRRDVDLARVVEHRRLEGEAREARRCARSRRRDRRRAPRSAPPGSGQARRGGRARCAAAHLRAPLAGEVRGRLADAPRSSSRSPRASPGTTPQRRGRRGSGGRRARPGRAARAAAGAACTSASCRPSGPCRGRRRTSRRPPRSPRRAACPAASRLRTSSTGTSQSRSVLHAVSGRPRRRRRRSRTLPVGELRARSTTRPAPRAPSGGRASTRSSVVPERRTPRTRSGGALTLAHHQVRAQRGGPTRRADEHVASRLLRRADDDRRTAAPLADDARALPEPYQRTTFASVSTGTRTVAPRPQSPGSSKARRSGASTFPAGTPAASGSRRGRPATSESVYVPGGSLPPRVAPFQSSDALQRRGTCAAPVCRSRAAASCACSLTR